MLNMLCFTYSLHTLWQGSASSLNQPSVTVPVPVPVSGSSNTSPAETDTQSEAKPLHSDKTAIPLPEYTTRDVYAVARGNVLVDMDRFIEETAYHIRAHGDMTAKGDYEEYGRRLVSKYPCLQFPGHKSDWVYACNVCFRMCSSICSKVSIK